MRKTKLLIAYLEKLSQLLEEKENIFFEERPFLGDFTKDKKIVNLNERRNQNEKEIKKICELMDIELAKRVPKETPIGEQRGLF